MGQGQDFRDFIHEPELMASHTTVCVVILTETILLLSKVHKIIGLMDVNWPVCPVDN